MNPNPEPSLEASRSDDTIHYDTIYFVVLNPGLEQLSGHLCLTVLSPTSLTRPRFVESVFPTRHTWLHTLTCQITFQNIVFFTSSCHFGDNCVRTEKIPCCISATKTDQSSFLRLSHLPAVCVCSDIPGFTNAQRLCVFKQ